MAKYSSNTVITQKTCKGLAGVLGLLTVVVALLNPIYHDEVSYLRMLGSYSSTYPYKVFLFPHCQSGFLVKVPLLFQPAAFFSSIATILAQSFIVIRLWNLVFVATMFWLLIRHIEKFSKEVQYDKLFLYGLAVSGLLPFLLVIARPETISILLVLIVALFFQKAKKHSLLQQGILLFITTLLLWIHPGNVIFLPVIALGAWRLVRGRYFRFLLLSGLLLSIVFQGIQMHKSSMVCDEDSKISDHLNNYSAGVFSGKNSYREVILENVKSRISSLIDYQPYITAVIPQTIYPFGIAPSVEGDQKPWGFFALTLSTFGILFVGLLQLVGRFYSSLKLVFRNRESRFVALTAAALIISLLGLNMAYPLKLPYRTNSLFWLIAFIYTLLPAGDTSLLARRPIRNLFFLLVTVSMVSFLSLYAPNVYRDLSLDVMAKRPLSSGIFSDFINKDSISIAREECGLNNLSNDSNPVIAADLVTQFSVNDFSRVAFVFYTASSTFFSPIEENIEESKIDHLFARCSVLPPKIRNQTTPVGPICCWSAKKPAIDSSSSSVFQGQEF